MPRFDILFTIFYIMPNFNMLNLDESTNFHIMCEIFFTFADLCDIIPFGGEQMHYEYRIVKECLNHPDIGDFETAGIEVLELNADASRVDFPSDVSTEFEDVQLLVELMNRVPVHPTMFHKIVEDIFYS